MSVGAGITVRDVWRALDDHFPFAHRADWDNVGILAGDPAGPVRRVLIALDATPPVLAACRRGKVDLLVTHHPIFLAPLPSVRPGAGAEGAAYELVRMGTAAICAHTNADVAPRGVSHVLARRVGLGEVRPLIPGEPASGACKIAVFVPAGREDAILSAVADAGGARIGAYDRCSFRSPGEGTFRPGAGARPAIGRPGIPTRVAEVRLETVVPGNLVPKVLAAVRAAHPYEEPAIDVYPLKAGALGGGVGAVGALDRPMSLGAALERIRRAVRPSWMKIAGRRRDPVRRVAVVGGSGAEFAKDARDAGADLFVTGDVKYHQALDAAAGGMPVVDIGHGAGEKWILPEFRKVLGRRFGTALSIRVMTEPEPLRLHRAWTTTGGGNP